MATDKPRFPITVDMDLLKYIEKFRYENGIASRSQAAVELIRAGMAAHTAMSGNGDVLTNREKSLLEGFRALDDHGKSAMMLIMSHELERCEAADDPTSGSVKMTAAAYGDGLVTFSGTDTVERKAAIQSILRKIKEQELEG